MAQHFTYIIIGGGLAGASAVEGIRERDRSGTIALFGKEKHLPYDRPPLSKGLWLGKTKVEELPVHDDAFYTSHHVHLYLGTEVTELIPSQHQIVTKDGSRYTYNKLLIATGGWPRTLPYGSDVLHYYRTVDDYRWLKDAAERAETFILIGGGFIGGELAAALTLNGKKVTMIFPEQSILQNVLPPDLASFVTEYYRSKGVTILNGEMPTNAERVKSGVAVTTKSGKTVTAEIAIGAIGLALHADVAQRAGQHVQNGVVVNNLLQTSDPDIYAAGDVAFFPALLLDETIRVEHWDNARAQGKHAGRNMAGANTPFDYLPFFYSDLFDLGFEAVGRLDSRLKTFADWKEQFREGVVYYLDNDRVKGVLLWNVWEKVDAARVLIGSKNKYASPDELKGVL
ncbi:MAG: N-acylamino acid racemase [Bacteroidia bacterium]|nr:MAG: N-acylamino acid racemase [Bacteroidia bacterium]